MLRITGIEQAGLDFEYVEKIDGDLYFREGGIKANAFPPYKIIKAEKILAS